MEVQGTALVGSGIVESQLIGLSDAFKKDVQVDSTAVFGGKIISSVEVEITDSFK